MSDDLSPLWHDDDPPKDWRGPLLRTIAEFFEVLRAAHIQRMHYGWWVYCPCRDDILPTRRAAVRWVLRHSWYVAEANVRDGIRF